MSITVKPLIRKLLDILCFVVGPMILTTSLLDFMQWAAYQPLMADERFGVGLGVALIAFGFLRIYWSRHEQQSKQPYSQ